MPVVMVNWLDWVVSVPVVAVTLTGVLTTPALTVMTTSPLLSDIAVGGLPAGVRVIPPIVVLKPKDTVVPLNGLPPISTTLNVTCEVSTPPMPFNEMVAGEAETNCKEPMAGAVTVKVA